MRWRAVLNPGQVARASAPGVLLTAWLVAGPGGEARAQRFAPRPVSDRSWGRDPGVRPARWTPADATEPAPAPTAAPRIEVAPTEIRTESAAAPGARVRLQVDGGTAEGVRFRWVQVEGPPVVINDPSQPVIEITVPGGAARLGFLLIAARPDVVRVARVTVAVQPSASDLAAGTAPAPGRVRADAGDDQVGLVGHRVTLNGSRSAPGDGKAARWLQVGGPPAFGAQHHGPFFSFIPSQPGVYRFVLIVAGGGEVSEPDEVNVLVGQPPAAAPGTAGLMPAPGVTPPAPATPEQVLAGTLPRLPDGPRVAAEVADVFEAVADRAGLYSSFAVLQAELTRRLDVVVPAEPSQRASWSQAVFNPLTAYTAGQLLTAGLDLRTPQGLQQPLTPAQQDLVRDHLRNLARAFRAAGAAR